MRSSGKRCEIISRTGKRRFENQAPPILPDHPPKRCSFREFLFPRFPQPPRETPVSEPDRYVRTVTLSRPVAREQELRAPMTGWARPAARRPRLVRRFARAFLPADCPSPDRTPAVAPKRTLAARRPAIGIARINGRAFVLRQHRQEHSDRSLPDHQHRFALGHARLANGFQAGVHRLNEGRFFESHIVRQSQSFRARQSTASPARIPRNHRRSDRSPPSGPPSCIPRTARKVSARNKNTLPQGM